MEERDQCDQCGKPARYFCKKLRAWFCDAFCEREYERGFIGWLREDDKDDKHKENTDDLPMQKGR